MRGGHWFCFVFPFYPWSIFTEYGHVVSKWQSWDLTPGWVWPKRHLPLHFIVSEPDPFMLSKFSVVSQGCEYKPHHAPCTRYTTCWCRAHSPCRPALHLVPSAPAPRGSQLLELTEHLPPWSLSPCHSFRLESIPPDLFSLLVSGFFPLGGRPSWSPRLGVAPVTFSQNTCWVAFVLRYPPSPIKSEIPLLDSQSLAHSRPSTNPCCTHMDGMHSLDPTLPGPLATLPRFWVFTSLAAPFNPILTSVSGRLCPGCPLQLLWWWSNLSPC